MIELRKDIDGSILDIGGGGEGVISSIYGNAVTAIDKSGEELDEVRYDCHKIVMDASMLDFPDLEFQNVTAFYAFMFIEKSKHRDVMEEVFRVLQQGGHLYIWDTDIEKDTTLPFLKDLDINANGKLIQTTYGITKRDPEQNAACFEALCLAAGFLPVTTEESGPDFYQHWVKPRRC